MGFGGWIVADTVREGGLGMLRWRVGAAWGIWVWRHLRSVTIANDERR